MTLVSSIDALANGRSWSSLRPEFSRTTYSASDRYKHDEAPWPLMDHWKMTYHAEQQGYGHYTSSKHVAGQHLMIHATQSNYIVPTAWRWW